MIFLVPCYYLPNNHSVVNCVESIKRHHPNDDILVVDSLSPDKSYKDSLTGSKVTWLDAHNPDYVTGVIRQVSEYDSDYYCILHDSTLVNKELKPFFEKEVGCVRWFAHTQSFSGFCYQESLTWGTQLLQRLNIPFNYTFKGILGSMFFGTKKVFTDYINTGIFDILDANNKVKDTGMERINGMILEYLGYPYWENSIQGEMGPYFGRYDETYITKLYLGRS